MSDKRFQQLLDEVVPDVPQQFHQAMTSVLEQIEAQAACQKDPVIPFPRWTCKKRVALAILMAALLTATIAAAVAGRDVFSIFWGSNAPMEEEFRSIIQHDVAERMVGKYRVRVDEAAYDGVSLYIKYSFRDMTIDHLLGTAHKSRKGSGQRVFTYEDDQAIAGWDVGFWRDGFWINGEYLSIPAESSGFHEPGDEPGEVELYYLFRLDNEHITLTGQNEITLPLGLWMSYEEMPKGENGELLPPEDNTLSFTVNADDLHGVTRVENGPVTTFPDGTQAWVSTADFTPIKLYLDIGYTIPEGAVDAYVERMGTDGYYDENGRLLYAFSAMDVASEWAYSMQLVEASGQPVAVVMGYGDGSQGMGPEQAYYVFPYMEVYPRPLFLAPVEDGAGDMERAILVLE